MIRALIFLLRFDALEMARWIVDKGIDISFWIIDRLLERKGALMRRADELLREAEDGGEGG